MTIALLGALVLVNTAFLLLLDRRDRRDERLEAGRWHVLHQEAREHREQIATLLQRIQFPQAAAAEHHAAVMPPEPPASPLPMSDHEMAAMQGSDGQTDVERIIARMEAVENGYLQPEDGLLA